MMTRLVPPPLLGLVLPMLMTWTVLQPVQASKRTRAQTLPTAAQGAAAGWRQTNYDPPPPWRQLWGRRMTVAVAKRQTAAVWQPASMPVALPPRHHYRLRRRHGRCHRRRRQTWLTGWTWAC